MNSEYYIDIEKRRLCLPGEAHMQPPPEMMPKLYFGSEPEIGFALPEGTLKIGDKLLFAIDVDKDFLTTAPMCVAEIAVLGANGTEPLPVSFQTRTQRFRDVVNARAGAVKCFFMAFVIRDEIQTTICDDFCFCHSVTALEGDPVVILPEEFYYTKEQINAIARQMEEWEENAEQAAKASLASAKDAADSQAAAATSVQNSYIWAEGTDAQVAALGGEHSAKGWAQEASHGGQWGSIGGDIEDQTDLMEKFDEYIPTDKKGAANGVAELDENGKVPSGELPQASASTLGIVQTESQGGTEIASGRIQLVGALNNDIDAKTNLRRPITAGRLNYAVRSVLPNITEIPAATSDYSLVDSSATTNNHSHVYSHAPTTAPTYRLPQVTDTTIAHYIELTVDFTAVQTYSFLDYQGEPIVPLFTPAIAAGDVYTFKMEYSAVKSAWLIYPQKQGAVADDFVMRGEVGAANGVASLGSNGKVPSSEIPTGTSTAIGGVKTKESWGVKTVDSTLQIVGATTQEVADRSTAVKPIVPTIINYAVTAALTDTNHITLTAEQQATAQEVLNIADASHVHIGNAAPTTSTVGKVGDIYLYGYMANWGVFQSQQWFCVAADEINGVYTWVKPMPSVSSNSFVITNNVLYPKKPTNGRINAREVYSIVTVDVLDYAVRSVSPNVTTIPSATTAYALLDATATTNSHSWQYTHAPSEASTYTLPAVTNTAVAHRIKLTIDFTTVQTYAFEDSQGTALAPLFTPTISAGDVYEFDCEYSVAKSTWLIWPHKQGAVSDDYVMQSEVGAANGVAGLDENGKLDNSQIHAATFTDGSGVLGGVRGAQNIVHGIRMGDGQIEVPGAPNARIDNRSWGAISGANLNYAVAAALTDANKIQLTDVQKASAQDTLGAYGTLHLDAAPTTSTVGAFGQRAIVDATGKEYTCTAVTVDETDPQNPVTTYTWQEDLPLATASIAGVVKINPNNGILLNSSKTATIYLASSAEIDWKSNCFKPVVPSCLDYAVRSVLENVTTIPDATSSYNLQGAISTTNTHSFIYEHAPTAASTYILPNVTQLTANRSYYRRLPSYDGSGYYAWQRVESTFKRYSASQYPSVGDNVYTNTSLTTGAEEITAVDTGGVQHEIILTVRFSSSVLTYAFEDSAGNTITPLPLAGTIADGSVVCFRCTWEALLGNWVIMPVMLGTYVAPQSGPHLVCVSENSAYAGNYYVKSGTGTSTVFYSRALGKYIWCDGSSWLLDSDMSSATAARLTLNAAEGSPMFSDPTGWSDMQDTTGTVSLTYVEA